MNRELVLLLKSLKSKTGIAVDVYSLSFVYLFSTGDKKIDFVYSGEVTDGLQDKKQNVTLFRFRFKNDLFYGVVSGSSEVERNYAMFICGHIENSSNQHDDNLSKAEFLRNIVLGDCSGMQIVKFMRKFNVPNAPCYVLVINTVKPQTQEVLEFLESYTINGADIAAPISEDVCVFVKFISSESDSDFQSPSEYAEVFSRSLYEETGIEVKVGVGCTMRGFNECVQSYVQAESSLKIGAIVGYKASVYSYKEFALYKMLEDMPSATLTSYYNILVDGEAKSIFANPDMLSTAEEFLDNNLNLSETARKLYMHRNTLTYRLDRIPRATGLNSRNFSDAATFRLCSLLYKILNK